MSAALGRTWWLILGALVAAAEIAIGVGIASEGNPGSIAGGAIIAAGGVAILAGIAWRRRARFAGDVAICAGAVPVLPFFWLYVPFIALVVIVAAALDAADARSLSRGSVPAPAATRRRTVLAVIAAAVLVAGLVLGSPAIALVVVAAAALAAVLVSSRRRSRPTT